MKEEKEVKVENKESKIEKRLAYLERKQKENKENWQRFVAKHVDKRSDGTVGSSKIGMLVLIAVIAFAMSAFGEEIDNKSKGTGTYTLTRASQGTGAITLAVDAVTGDLTGNVTGNVTSSGLSVSTPTSADVTTGAVYTVVADYTILSGVGQADGSTNAITLANPVTIGKSVVISISGTSSNFVSLADSGNLKLTGAFEMDNYDNISLFAQETNVWVETSRSDN